MDHSHNRKRPSAQFGMERVERVGEDVQIRDNITPGPSCCGPIPFARALCREAGHWKTGNRNIGSVLSAFKEFLVLNYSKIDEMAHFSISQYFPIATNFSARRSHRPEPRSDVLSDLI